MESALPCVRTALIDADGMSRPDSCSLPDLHEVEGEFAALLALLDPDEALQHAARLVTTEVGLPVGFIAVPAGDDAVRICRTHGTRTDALLDVLVPTGCGLGGKVAALGRTAWVRDYCGNPSITHQFDPLVRAEGLHAMIAVPLQRGDTLAGVLYGADRREGEFGGKAAKRMEAVAARASLTLQVAERARHVAEVAVHEERMRMSVALHDSVGAMLFAISTGARELATATESMPDVAERALEIESRSAAAAAALRRSLRGLHATPEELALEVTLQADCRAFEQRTGLRTRVFALTDLPPLEPAAADALLSTVREAMLNIEKHAQATSVVVTVSTLSAGVAVAVTDDGCGLASAAEVDGRTAQGSGLGLEAAAVRLGRLGGRLQVRTNDEGGVTLRAWLPR